MMPAPGRSELRRTLVLAFAGGLLTLSASAQQQPPTQPPPFKSRVTVVPVDVRVLDRSGKPITDLTAADFTVTEEGVPDAIFKAPGAVRSRSTDGETNADADAQRTADQRRQRDIMLRAAVVEARLAAGVGAGLDYRVLDEMELIDAGNFDDYVAKSFDTNVDLGNLYAGIRYLRLLDGEKHLVFISSRGLFLPRLESANSLAAFANDARVTIDVIHTAGTVGSNSGPRGSINNVYTYGSVGSYGQLFQNANSAQIAELTGGQMTSVNSGEAFFRRLDVATRAQYLLGYVPSSSNWDGKYRRINVRVNRPGAQVLYRHGYVARDETTMMDGQQYLMYTRIASALNLARELRDVGIELGEPSVQGTGAQRSLSVTLRILPNAVTLKPADGHYVGKLEAMSICADRNRQVVGELWHTINVKITEEEYQRFLREGTSATMQMQVSGEPRYLKTVLYDYTGDRLGSIMREIAKK
jgi:VWFA-related protein